MSEPISRIVTHAAGQAIQVVVFGQQAMAVDPGEDLRSGQVVGEVDARFEDGP
jgi:hypothetical protein